MKRTKYTLLKHTSGLRKLTFCFLFSLVVYIVLTLLSIDLKIRIILGWDTFCFMMIVLSWLLFFSTKQDELVEVVAQQDEGLKAIFMIVLVAVCFSLFGTILLLINKKEPSFNKILYAIITISPVVFSWILLHTTFTVRYAHLYHDHNKLKTGSKVGGVDFPTKEHPDYIDFAYFSFVIGMTFQVSDVQVNSRIIRRFVLFHSLISFMFNTIIVALTINTIASLSD